MSDLILKTPLVSIVVVTYNSAEYILEALNSCKNQTYDNIELIISDDASKDNTVVICEKWLKKNGDRFAKAKLITSENNTGIAPNLNRGVKESSGDWVKQLAGDDGLMPSIITDYIQHIKQKPQIKIIHSNPIVYNENFNEDSLVEKKDCSHLRINSPNISSDEQFQILLRSGPIYASTAMIHRSVYEKIGNYDERAPFWEDTPFWIKATRNGYMLHHYPVFGAKYRVRDNSVQKTNNEMISKFLVSKIEYKFNELRKYYTLKEKLNIIQRYIALRIILLLGNTRNLFIKGVWFISIKLSGIINKL